MPHSCCCRILTCTYLGLVYGILFYNTPSDTLTGLRNRMSICFLILMMSSLLVYVSVSLYTNDKKVYLADSSAQLYRPWAYYTSKLGACWWRAVTTNVHISRLGVVDRV
jgi:hypothetical protein